MTRKKSHVAIVLLMVVAALFGCQCGGGPKNNPAGPNANQNNPAGGPSERDKLVEEFNAAQDEGTAIVTKIVDKASAQKAIPELEALTKKVKGLTARAAALPKKTPQDTDKWGQHFRQIENGSTKFQAAWRAMGAKTGREIPHEMTQPLGRAIAGGLVAEFAEFRKNFDAN
jgi:hypothetical protein